MEFLDFATVLAFAAAYGPVGYFNYPEVMTLFFLNIVIYFINFLLHHTPPKLITAIVTPLARDVCDFCPKKGERITEAGYIKKTSG